MAANTYRKASGNTRKAVRKAMRNFHPNPCCHYCNKTLDWDAVYSPLSTREEIREALKTAVTLDHVIPAVKGGAHHTDNMVIACQPCNETRGHMAYWMFKILRKTVGLKGVRFLRRNSIHNIVKYKILRAPPPVRRGKVKQSVYVPSEETYIIRDYVV